MNICSKEGKDKKGEKRVDFQIERFNRLIGFRVNQEYEKIDIRKFLLERL